MAVRKLAIAFGQSPTGPWHDIESWLTDRPDLNLLLAPRRVSGSTDTQFTVPNSIPGFNSSSKSLRGTAIRTVRFFVLYNPVATGYSSYPGTARVAGQVFNSTSGSSTFLGLPNGLTHSTTNIYVEQRFKSGSNGVASVFRKLTQTTHTVSSVLEMTKSFVDADVNAATNEITLSAAGSAFVVGNAVRFLTTGTLPAGLSALTVYYVKTVGATVTLSATSGGATLDLTAAAGSGTHTMVHAYTTATDPATVGSRLTVTPAFDPPPSGHEELTFTHTANSGGSTTTTVLSMNYGLLRTGDLRSLRLRCITATNTANQGQSVAISGWSDVTRTVTHAAFPQATSAGDTFAIEPISGVAFDRFGMWLPWSMFERDLNVDTFGDISKSNPYPPGFDYPSHWHLPQMYGLSNQPVTTTLGLKLTVNPYISWTVGGMVRLAEILGEEVWCLQCDFGGSSTAHREFELGTRVIGWYDPAQQNDWSIAKTNSCYQRFLDELDAAIAAAALVGDTLELVGVWRAQSDGDATTGYNGYQSTGGQQGMPVWRDKYLASNRAFRAKVRAALKARGLWSRDANKIPWVQALLTEDTVDQTDGDPTSAEEINAHLLQLADEDRYAASWDPTGIPLWDGIHYTGEGLDDVEKLSIDAWREILAATDQSGEVDLVNVALAHLGEAGLVTSIEPVDGSFLSQIAATFYPRARRAVLELHNWQFATSRRALSKLYDNPATSWAFAYVAPANMIRAISVLPAQASDDYMALGLSAGTSQTFAGYISGSGDLSRSTLNEYRTGALTSQNVTTTQPFDIERRADGTKIIHTNQDEAHLRYVRDVYDTKLFSELFAQAVSWKLAAMLAGPVIKGQAGQQAEERAMKMMQWYVSKARETDGAQRNIKPDPGMPFSRG